MVIQLVLVASLVPGNGERPYCDLYAARRDGCSIAISRLNILEISTKKLIIIFLLLSYYQKANR